MREAQQREESVRVAGVSIDRGLYLYRVVILLFPLIVQLLVQCDLRRINLRSNFPPPRNRESETNYGAYGNGNGNSSNSSSTYSSNNADKRGSKYGRMQFSAGQEI